MTKKISYNSRNKVREIYDDLEEFRDFTRKYGYRFNEADLYNHSSAVYQQFLRLKNGKKPRNMWSEELSRMAH